jgi:hypothetical protein
VAEVVLLNSFYADAPTLRLPEFIGFFATPSLSALARHFLQRPALFAELLQFQRGQFRALLASEHQAGYDDFLGPLIDENFRQQPGAGPAFGQMTAQLLPELARNTHHLADLEGLNIPFRLV